MITDKDLLSIEVATLYYEHDKTQQEIAKQLNISRPTISKLLTHAKEKDFVQITIKKPENAIQALEKELKEKYNLKDVRVAYTNHLMTDQQTKLLTLGKEVALYLEKNVQSSQRIGISWGQTLYHTAQQLIPKDVQDVEIVQLKGGMNIIHADTHDQEIMSAFVKNFQGRGHYIPLPTVFSSIASKNLMMKEKQIQNIMEKLENIDIALYTIGIISTDSLLYQTGSVTEEEFQHLQKQGVCDICSHFIDQTGNLVLNDLDERTFAISLEQLKKVPNSVLVASGEEKVAGIYTALKHRIPNVLITDSLTALKLLEY